MRSHGGIGRHASDGSSHDPRSILSWHCLQSAGEQSPKQLTLFFSHKSHWSSVVRLALQEKGLQVDLRQLNLFVQEHLTVLCHFSESEKRFFTQKFKAVGLRPCFDKDMPR